MYRFSSTVKGLASFLVAVLLLAGSAAAVGAAGPDFPTITSEGLKEMIGAKRDFTLIDARTPEEYQDAHIVNAVNIQEKGFDAALPTLPKSKDALLVVYCNGVKCGKSKKVAIKAAGAAYRNILVYTDGFPVWEEKGYPVVTGPNYSSKVKTVKVGAHDLDKLLKEKGQEYLLVDVREPREFAEGHIPGAVNIPVDTFAAQSGQLPKEKGIIVYDNTGSRSYLAYRKLMKLAYPSIYEATFAEWKDAKLPIAK